jgi:hypothetical protein
MDQASDPRYSASDFVRLLDLSVRQANLIEDDYRQLISFDTTTEIGRTVFEARQNLHAISIFAASRYDLTKQEAGMVARLFGNVSRARRDQLRHKDLGIAKCVWMTAVCNHKSHVRLDGKKFDSQKGMMIRGQYLFPGVAIGCLCVQRAVIDGLN